MTCLLGRKLSFQQRVAEFFAGPDEGVGLCVELVWTEKEQRVHDDVKSPGFAVDIIFDCPSLHAGSDMIFYWDIGTLGERN
jgi:hypothetical protein